MALVLDGASKLTQVLTGQSMCTTDGGSLPAWLAWPVRSFRDCQSSATKAAASRMFRALETKPPDRHLNSDHEPPMSKRLLKERPAIGSVRIRKDLSGYLTWLFSCLCEMPHQLPQLRGVTSRNLVGLRRTRGLQRHQKQEQDASCKANKGSIQFNSGI